MHCTLALGLLIGGVGCDSDDGNTSTGGTMAPSLRPVASKPPWRIGSGSTKAARLGYDESSVRLALLTAKTNVSV